VDIAALISSFTTGTYVVTRTAAEKLKRGRVPASPSETTFSITAAVTAAMGSDLMRLAEGIRTNETHAVFTTTQLFVGGQGADFEPDQISIDGEDWQVQHCERWTDPVSGGLGFRALVQAIR
jgi:hypothetical protein